MSGSESPRCVISLSDSVTVSTTTFYGKPKLRDSLRLEKLGRKEVSAPVVYPYKLLNPCSPTTTWKVFRKQNEALQFARERKNGVMSFVFHDDLSGERLFLVAHPLVFWFYDCQRKRDRSSYEIITEHTVCKLYFDMEYSKELNPSHEGLSMINTFISIVCFYLKCKWNIHVTRDHVLDLDSTTETKFSRHLIFQLPNYAFQDNYNVGNFVKSICDQLRRCVSDNENHEFLENSDIKIADVKSLFVMDAHGKRKLFCDESVYTKNRHFRLYLSSKWRKKNAALLLSKENKYLPNQTWKQLNTLKFDKDTLFFLDSLITYIPQNEHLEVLECEGSNSVSFSAKVTDYSAGYKVVQSPYPEIDVFIKQVVSPGTIRRSCYFNPGNCIVYDIAGYRYCSNICREHKSNNIKYIVDLNKKCYHQKCYDIDCFGYRSEQLPLPVEVVFHLDDGIVDVHSTSCLGYFGIPNNELGDLLDVIENENIYQAQDDKFDNELVSNQRTSLFPDFGVSDLELLNVSECDIVQ